MPNTIKTNNGRFKKGQIPWNLGIAMTLEVKQKLLEANLGAERGPYSKEHKAKISLANTGKKRSKEMREKMRQAKSFTSDETKLKMRNAKLGTKVSEKTKKRMSKAQTGRTWSEEAKNKVSGANSNLWRGGVTVLRKQIRSCFEYRQWRSDVFTRDRYACQICGRNDGSYLNAHHIILFEVLLQKYEITKKEQAVACDEMWNINNGVTLCNDCHKDMHRNRKM